MEQRIRETCSTLTPGFLSPNTVQTWQNSNHSLLTPLSPSSKSFISYQTPPSNCSRSSPKVFMLSLALREKLHPSAILFVFRLQTSILGFLDWFEGQHCSVIL